MVNKETISARCAGVMRDLTVEFGRTHYTVTFPWGAAVKIGMNYGRGTAAGRVLGDSRRVADEAIAFTEGQTGKKLTPALVYALRPGASIEEMSWACQRLGLLETTGRQARASSAVIAEARQKVCA